MVKFTLDQIRQQMDNPDNIRNISVIAHVDHGKTTLTDSLMAAAGIIAVQDVGDVRAASQRPDEQARGITIKSSGFTLHFALPEHLELPSKARGREFLINLIDSPGHVDFSSEVTAALRVTDGALVVVDIVEGVCVQTETVLRQALAERIVPVLCINKLDRGFLELQLNPEEMYQAFRRVIESANVVISTYTDDLMGNVCVYPERGTVAFSAGLQGWGFTLTQFANIWAERLKLPAAELRNRLWGDNFFDSETRKWSTTGRSASGKPLQRSFCQFVLEPVQEVFKACTDGDWERIDRILSRLHVTLPSGERQLTGKKLIKAIMQKWLPADQALLEMICLRLPSPVIAQRYRVENLYTGPLDDPTAAAIASCDPNGPLVVYVSKLIPSADRSRFFAFGRVFAGTVKAGLKVNILGANYEHGREADRTVKSIQRTVMMMGGRCDAVESIPAGSTCGLVGIDQFITKTATLTTEEHSHPLVSMKFSVSPVVRVAVSPKNPTDLPRLIEALRRLSKSDQLVQCTHTDTGEHIVAAAGELHLEICLNDLREEFIAGAELVVSDPVVSFRETVMAKSSHTCLSKSPNKLNRLFAIAEPFPEGLADAIERGDVAASQEPRARGRKLADDFGWDLTECRKIWAFGPNTDGPNILFDVTKGVQHLASIKDSVEAGFQWVTSEGVLTGESLRGVRFNIIDALVHPDAAHHGAGQIIPAARRVMAASQLTAQPRVMEPMFLATIQAPQAVVGSIYSLMSRRRGQIIDEQQRPGTPLVTLRAYLPVMESFGFPSDLRATTSGQAFPQMVFDHWALLPGDPTEVGSMAERVVASIRKRKGLPAALPTLDRFHDKL
eukprot:TRINITY_DN18420_c0_g1_i1.p1 TRINITY_DN18420_c0_g1~~TRINITY_DN18420_c0_g1_i1.p1  ORF type:complete len:859 (+),score=302.26 TRINITY_DN18420_c0_g1_i1:54-2579(+)